MVFAVTKCTEELYKEIVKRECNILPYASNAMDRAIIPLYFTIELICGMPYIGCSYASGFQYAKILDKETFLNYYRDFTLEIKTVLDYNDSKMYAIRQLITEIKDM